MAESSSAPAATSTKNQAASNPQTDVILAMQEPWMQHLVDGKKNYEFRKYQLKSTVERVWFYRTAPHSSLDYICEIEPALARGPGCPKLEDDGIGNVEFNDYENELDTSYNFAYKVISIRKIDQPLSSKELRSKYGVSPPRGMIYTPQTIMDDIDWRQQTEVRRNA